MQAMKFVQQAIRLRGYAQRDPFTQHKLEGCKLPPWAGILITYRHIEEHLIADASLACRP